MLPQDMQTISRQVADTLIEASVCFRKDQITRYEMAVREETNSNAVWALQAILDNAAAGATAKLPLCDDTGIPHLFLELGDEAVLPAGFLPAVEEGVALGLRELPGRPMAVKGDEETRLAQSEGMFEDSGLLAPAPLQIRRCPGRQVRLTVLMLGGGPEIRGKTLRVFHKHSMDTVAGEMVSWGREGASLLGCQPCILAYGIGRSNMEAASLALEAMKDGNLLEQSPLERRITQEINTSGIGPLGLGGTTTVLGTFLKVGPQRASGVRIVSLRVGCCFDPRKAICVWDT